MDGVENLMEAKRNENQGMVRLVFALVIISLMVSTIAIILSATSLSKEGTTINVGDAAGSTGGSSAGNTMVEFRFRLSFLINRRNTHIIHVVPV